MRILLLHDYGTPIGGAERSVLHLRDGLRARGHDVRLLTGDRRRNGEPPLEADATTRGTADDRAAAALRVLNPWAVADVRAELRRFRPDVVHARMLLTQLSPAVLPLLADVPLIHHLSWYRAICPRGTKLLPDGGRCEVHAGLACLRNRCVTARSWPLDMAQLAAYRRLRRVVDVTVALSETMAARLREAHVAPVRVIPNGVPQRAARPPLRAPARLAFAGRLVAEKGVDVLLRALVELPGVALDVLGAGPERTAMETLSQQLGVADRVTFTGHLDARTMEERLDAAWIQVVPGRWEEPFGNVVLEAMARGTAVVASAIGAPHEIVVPEETGALVPPDDPGALAATLRTLLADRDGLERLGAAGRRLVADQYSVDRLLDRCEALYAELGSSRT